VSHKCKFCPQSFVGYYMLRGHVERSHPAEFLKIRHWLGRTQDSLWEAERIAKDGLLGPGQTPHERRTEF
jgi:hypothetical protein